MQSKPLNDQQHVFIAVMGASGHGKTSLLWQQVEEAALAGKRVAIVDPKNQWPEWQNPAGLPRWPANGVHGVDDLLRALIDSGEVDVIILDDADMYLHSQARTVFAELFSSYRHIGVDLVVNTRRPQEVPKIAFSSISYLALFNQREPHAQEYIARLIAMDPQAINKVPRKKFQYLLVNVDTGESKVYRTRRMPEVASTSRANQKRRP